MENPDILFKIAEARRKELMKEAENYRLAHQAKKARPSLIDPPFTWALVGATLAAVLTSLLV